MLDVGRAGELLSSTALHFWALALALFAPCATASGAMLRSRKNPPLHTGQPAQAAPSKEQQMAPRANGQAKPQPNGQAKPQTNGHAKPQEDGQAKPQADGQAKPQANGQAKPQANGQAKPQPPQVRFEAGDYVQGRWGKEWLPATIGGANDDGTYWVTWIEDGSWTDMVVDDLRRAKEPTVAQLADFVEALTSDMADLAAQVRAISVEAFDEDATKTEKGERVGLLVLQGEVLGYASYTIRPHLSSLNVNKLAVLRNRRRQGLGRCLVKHLVQLAKRGGPAAARGGKAQKPLEVVCLSALPTAVTFYKALGFREEREVRLPDEDDEELIEGQVYMEFPLRRKRGK